MNVGTKTTLIFNFLFFSHINEIIISILLLLDRKKKMTSHGDSQQRGLIMCSALVSLAYNMSLFTETYYVQRNELKALAHLEMGQMYIILHWMSMTRNTGL